MTYRVVAKERVQGPQIVARELVQGAIAVFCHLYNCTRDMVSLPEGHALANKVIRQVGGQHRKIQSCLHLVLPWCKRGHHTMSNLDASTECVRGIEEGLLVLLRNAKKNVKHSNGIEMEA